jgi:hypothetical protein
MKRGCVQPHLGRSPPSTAWTACSIPIDHDGRVDRPTSIRRYVGDGLSHVARAVIGAGLNGLERQVAELRQEVRDPKAHLDKDSTNGFGATFDRPDRRPAEVALMANSKTRIDLSSARCRAFRHGSGCRALRSAAVWAISPPSLKAPSMLSRVNRILGADRSRPTDRSREWSELVERREAPRTVTATGYPHVARDPNRSGSDRRPGSGVAVGAWQRGVGGEGLLHRRAL